MRVSLPEHLSEHFRVGRHYLVVTAKQAFIAERSAVFHRVNGRRPGRAMVVDLQKAWRDFSRTIGPQRDFTRPDLVKISRVDGTILRLWELGGILYPAGGFYNVEDAFAAGLCGMLRRRGVPVPIIHKAGIFVRTGAGLGVRG